MRKSKKWFFLVTAVACMAIGGSVKQTFSRQVSIKVTLTMEKRVYRLGEPVLVEFRIENQSSDVVLISKRIMQPNYLDLSITDEKGTPVKYIGEVYKLARITPCDFVVLLPGYFYGKEFDISRGKEAFEINRSGKYTLTGYYENHDKDELSREMQVGKFKKEFFYSPEQIWAGRIDFMPIEFEVMKE
jgi:hypothetical protein